MTRGTEARRRFADSALGRLHRVEAAAGPALPLPEDRAFRAAAILRELPAGGEAP